MYLVLPSLPDVPHEVELLGVEALAVEDVVEVVHAAVDDVVHGEGDALGQHRLLIPRGSMSLDGVSTLAAAVNFLNSIRDQSEESINSIDQSEAGISPIWDQTGDDFGLCPGIREIGTRQEATESGRVLVYICNQL